MTDMARIAGHVAKLKARKKYAARWKPRFGDKYEQREFDKKEEAEQFLAEMRVKLKDERANSIAVQFTLAKIPFIRVAIQYLHELRDGFDGRDPVEPQTYRTYRGYIKNHIAPLMIGYSIGEVTAETVALVRDRALKNTSSRRSAREVLRQFKAILAHAARRQLIDSVPGAAVKVPTTRAEMIDRKVKRDLRAYTPEQVRTILGAADSLSEDSHSQKRRAWQLYRGLVYFLVYTGVRISEARGFPRDALDTTRNRVHIRQRASEKGELDGTKSADGVRHIPLHPALVNPLQVALDSHNYELAFASEEGTPRSTANLYNRMLKPLLARANELAAADADEPPAGRLPYVPVPRLGEHAFRHAFASRLIAGGCPPKRLQTLMGHHSFAFTMDTYGHLYEDIEGDAELMSRITV